VEVIYTLIKLFVAINEHTECQNIGTYFFIILKKFADLAIVWLNYFIEYLFGIDK